MSHQKKAATAKVTWLGPINGGEEKKEEKKEPSK